MHSLSMCSPGTFPLLLKTPGLQHKSHLGNDSLHTEWNIGYSLTLWHQLWYVISWLPSQTGQPHGLVIGWGQVAAGHGFFVHRTEPLCKRRSTTLSLKRLTIRSENVNMCVLMLPGRCIQSRDLLGQGLTGHLWGLHCYGNSLSNKDRLFCYFVIRRMLKLN